MIFIKFFIIIVIILLALSIGDDIFFREIITANTVLRGFLLGGNLIGFMAWEANNRGR